MKCGKNEVQEERSTGKIKNGKRSMGKTKCGKMKNGKRSMGKTKCGKNEELEMKYGKNEVHEKQSVVK